MSTENQVMLWFDRLSDYVANGDVYHNKYLDYLVKNLGAAIGESYPDIDSICRHNVPQEPGAAEVAREILGDLDDNEGFVDLQDTDLPGMDPEGNEDIEDVPLAPMSEEPEEDFTAKDEEVRIRLQRYALKEYGILPKNFNPMEYIPLDSYYRRYKSSFDRKSENEYSEALDLLEDNSGVYYSQPKELWKEIILKGRVDSYFSKRLPYLDYLMANIAVQVCRDSLHQVENLDEGVHPFSDLRTSLERLFEADPTLFDITKRDELVESLADVFSSFNLFLDDIAESEKLALVIDHIVDPFFPVSLNGHMCFCKEQVADCLDRECDIEGPWFVVEEAVPLEGKWFGGDIKVFFNGETPCRLGEDHIAYKAVDDGSVYNYEVFGVRIVKTSESDCIPLKQRIARKEYEFPTNGQSYKFKRYDFDDVLDYVSTVSEIRRYGEKVPIDVGAETVFKKFADVIPYVTFNLVLATGNLGIKHPDVYGAVSEFRAYKRDNYSEDAFRLALRSNNLGPVEAVLPDSFFTELLSHIKL